MVVVGARHTPHQMRGNYKLPSPFLALGARNPPHPIRCKSNPQPAAISRNCGAQKPTRRCWSIASRTWDEHRLKPRPSIQVGQTSCRIGPIS